MVVIVRSFQVPAVELQNLSRVPSTDDLRPSHCPSCGVAAGFPGNLRMVGHGLFQRQVLGLPDARSGIVIHVRRFLCLACRRTASVLPDDLHPRRWYSAAAILCALVFHLLQGQSAAAVRAMLGDASGASDWKSLRRWQRQLLSPLWRWVAAELGFSGCDPNPTRTDCCSRLSRFLGLHGGDDRSPPDELARIARVAGVGTAHSREESWVSARTA